MDTHSGIIAWFARNHVAANLLMLVIVIAGLVAATSIRTQVNPDYDSDTITIQTSYPGAAPGEVESAVVKRIEEAVRDVNGIEEMRSFSREGTGSVRLRIETDADLQDIMDEVQMRVDRITSLPGDTERPVITRSFKQIDAINVQVYGNLDEWGMKSLASEIRDEILSLPSVTRAELAGARPYEIGIEVSPASLREYGLTLAEVAQAVRNSSVDVGAGSIQTEAGDILLRTQGQAYNAAEFENLVLMTREDGTRVTLGDVATVNDGFVDQDFYSRFNGRPSIGISVSAVGDQNQIDISNEVKAYVAERKQTLPDGVHLDAWMDSTEYLSQTLNMMLSNVAFGILLVLLVLGLFLRLQLAFWVMLGMPIAFLGAFALLPLTGGSINMISLFGFILVLGIVVDDAIIIGESVQSSFEDEGHNVDAVIRGAKRVAVPATFGVLTTIATFTPLLTVPGSFGAVPASIGWVVILCLVFSIIESKLILPAHLTSMKPVAINDGHMHPVWRVQSFIQRGLQWFINRVYAPFIERAIENRYTTVASFIGLLIVAIGFTLGPWVQTAMFPDISSGMMRARVEMVEGTPSSQTARVVAEITDELAALNEEQPGEEKFVKNFMAYIYGRSGNVIVDIRGATGIDPDAFASEWRQRVGDIVGTERLEIEGAEKSHGGGGDVSFKLMGGNIEQLKAAASFMEQRLGQYAGLYQIENNAEGSIPEMNIELNASGESLGLTLEGLARQVRGAFYGIEAQRLQRDGEEIRVLVRYPKEQRQSLGSLESMYVRTPAGELVPFPAVASVDEHNSPSMITRIDGERSVEVSADVDFSTVRPGDIIQEIMSRDFERELSERFPGVRVQLGGASEMENELTRHMTYASILGLFAIYALMAIPLKSYLQPLIIMGVIPFGMIGALIGHMIVGIPFSALSIFGLVALAGVVVNDSIIMVDFVNKSVDAGEELRGAVIKAGTRRFRPILLTSLTTFFGLLPILVETTLSAQIVIPMAVSLGFGIVFATLITLILIPCLYVVLDDVGSLSRSFRHQLAS